MAVRRYEIDMSQGSILKNLINFAIPLMLTSVLQLLYNAADIVVVGRWTGSAALAAIGQCTLPILTKPADIPTDENAARQRAIEERLEAYLTLTYPTPQAAGYLLRRHPWIQK